MEITVNIEDVGTAREFLEELETKSYNWLDPEWRECAEQEIVCMAHRELDNILLEISMNQNNMDLLH